jgi:hypothetical protein
MDTDGRRPAATLGAIVVAVMLVAVLLTAAAAPILLVIVSASAAGVVVARAILHRRRATSGSERSSPDRGAQASTARRYVTSNAGSRGAAVSQEYEPLNAYLARRHASYVVLTFEQMESLLGFPLPAVASTEAEWWTSLVEQVDGHTKTWTAAGRTAIPNLLARNVAFTRSA